MAVKFIGGAYFGFVAAFYWNSQLWLSKRDNIVLFWVWNFVFATVMSTQGCVYVYFLLQQLPDFLLTILKQFFLTEGFGIFQILHCPLHKKLHGKPSGMGAL